MKKNSFNLELCVSDGKLLVPLRAVAVALYLRDSRGGGDLSGLHIGRPRLKNVVVFSIFVRATVRNEKNRSNVQERVYFFFLSLSRTAKVSVEIRNDDVSIFRPKSSILGRNQGEMC